MKIILGIIAGISIFAIPYLTIYNQYQLIEKLEIINQETIAQMETYNIESCPVPVITEKEFIGLQEQCEFSNKRGK